jgi:two-component system chemotaxis response regulator CheB
MVHAAVSEDGQGGAWLPGPKARVLIIDDSVVARGLFNRWVSEHPRLVVAGTAADGVNGIRAAARLKPDIIILDLDMPVMDGLTALPDILKASPGSAVVIASSLTARSARLTMQCLALGATDLQPKPQNNRDLTMSLSFREELMARLVGLIETTEAGQRQAMAAGPDTPRGRAAGSALAMASHADSDALLLDVAPRALLIGASTGGPRAVMTLLETLGETCDQFAVIIAQHMPAMFTASLAEQMAARLKRPAREAGHGEVPQPGQIYIAPGGRHLRLAKSESQVLMRLDDSAPVNFCRPAIDLVFGDAAVAYGASALGVVLTGMGSDGLEGARLLRQSGARIIAQDEATSVVWGMPGAVSRHGIAHHVLPLPDIGPAITAAMRAKARPTPPTREALREARR